MIAQTKISSSVQPAIQLPTALSAPWIYLAATVAATIGAIGVVSAATVRLARRSPLTVLGEL